MTSRDSWLSLGFDHPAVRLWTKFQAATRGCQLRCGPYAWDLRKGSRVVRIGRRHFASVEHLAADFEQLFKTLVANHVGDEDLLDFSHIQLHNHRASGIKFELAQWPEPDAMIEAYLARYQPSSNDLVFDLGAGCGISTFAFSNLAKNVVAFESDPQLRVILERNVERLGLTNVTVAQESAACFADLLKLHNKPAFVKVNLDQVSPLFFSNEGQPLTSLATMFAGGSRSKRIRKQFSALLQQNAFETESNDAMGVIWARPADDVFK